MWVPRARNARADRLANQAMDAAQGLGDSGAPRGRASRGGKAGGNGPGANPGDDKAGEADGAGAIRSGRSKPAAGTTAPAQRATAARGWGPAAGRATTTLLLRHGQTPLSAEGRFAGRGDVPLTDTGKRQAVAAAARLGARGGIDVIVSSPLRRARRTAEAVAETTGAPVLVDDDLVEADFGKWEGLSFAEAGEQYPDEMAAWLASADAAPPGGESFATAAHRVLGALDRLLAAHPERTLLLVSHVTPIKTLLCRALLAPPAALFRIHLDVASLCEVDWFADGPALVRSVNDTAHLR
jgi:probable phosphoglycerate mutase